MPRTRMQAIPSLTRWGLSADADIVYRTLVLYGAKPSSALARELGIHRTRIDQALCDLRDARAIAEWAEAGRAELQWHATPAPALLARLSRRLPARLPPASPRPAESHVDMTRLGPGMVHLRSREATRRRLGELSQLVRHEDLTMYTETSFDAAAIKGATPMVAHMLGRGVQMRVLGLQSNPDLHFADVMGPGDTRAVYREATQVPMKLMIIDRKVALFPVNPADFEQGYLEVTQEPLVGSLVSLFEQHWAEAHDPLKDAMPQFTMTPREQAVVALLSTGHTDAGAARELRISERSVSTIVRSIMDRLGVDNRFQLGVALGTLNAAPPPPGLNTLMERKDTEENQ